MMHQQQLESYRRWPTEVPPDRVAEMAEEVLRLRSVVRELEEGPPLMSSGSGPHEYRWWDRAGGVRRAVTLLAIPEPVVRTFVSDDPARQLTRFGTDLALSCQHCARTTLLRVEQAADHRLLEHLRVLGPVAQFALSRDSIRRAEVTEAREAARTVAAQAKQSAEELRAAQRDLRRLEHREAQRRSAARRRRRGFR